MKGGRLKEIIEGALAWVALAVLVALIILGGR